MEKETTKKKEEYKILGTTINDNGGLDIEALNLLTNKKVIFKNCTIKDMPRPYGLKEGPMVEVEVCYSGEKYDETN